MFFCGKDWSLFWRWLFLQGLSLQEEKSGRYASAQKVEANKLVVLDPGHGGRDPGKVGVGDVLEKDLNLAIAKKVKKILEKDGLEVIMTREKDEMLCSEDASNKKSRRSEKQN